MFKLAFLIAVYSYLIFLLGILHLLRKEIILVTTLIYLLISFRIFFKQLIKFPLPVRIYLRRIRGFSVLCIILIIIQALINFIGTLGPELGFDALWYHLTIPKIYLQENSIFYIGGHLYYSAMPKLTEMLYLAALALGNEITAKIIHFLFGIAVLISLYKMSRIFLSSKDSLLVSLIFYSNLVVGWMSITAYIDLARTFFEIMALWSFFIFIKYRKLRWFILSATMIGFAVSTKLLSMWSVVIYICLVLYLFFQKKIGAIPVFKLSILYCAVVSIIISPWIIFSYLNTGYPFYPLFSPLQQSLNESMPLFVFLLSADPISPIYFISLPIIIFYFFGFLFKAVDKESRLTINLMLIYLISGFSILYFTPPASSGRFIMPNLAAFSLLFVLLINFLKAKSLYKFLLIVAIIVSISSIFYRGAANKRFIPLIFGREDKQLFMLNNLEYHVGNFYDVDNFFANRIKPYDKVLIYGISNLYYVNFPYIHESLVKKGDKFDYILTKDVPLPERFKNWKLEYKNDKTRVELYSLNGQIIEY